MQIFKNSRWLAPLGVILALALGTPPNAGAVVIKRWTTGDNHPTQTATAVDELATALGGGSTRMDFSGTSDLAWSSALAGGDMLFIGQTNSTSALSAATRTAVETWVSGGGVLLTLWSSVNVALIDDVLGTSMAPGWGFTGSVGLGPISKTPAAAGTTYDAAAAVLPGLSNHGGIALGSITSGLVAYEHAGFAHVLSASHGAGSAHFLSWDWCCGDGAGDRDLWDAALLAAATFGGASVPEPGTFVLLALGLAGIARQAGRMRHR